jgi:transposase-like protein
VRKTKKHKVFSITEKNQIVLLYLDNHIGVMDIVRSYGIGNRSQLYRWVRQYRDMELVLTKEEKQQRMKHRQKGDQGNTLRT